MPPWRWHKARDIKRASQETVARLRPQRGEAPARAAGSLSGRAGGVGLRARSLDHARREGCQAAPPARPSPLIPVLYSARTHNTQRAFLFASSFPGREGRLTMSAFPGNCCRRFLGELDWKQPHTQRLPVLFIPPGMELFVTAPRTYLTVPSCTSLQ